MEEPIGVITDLHEDEYGLYMEGRLLLDVERAREAYALLKEGVVRGLSIGYRPTKYQYDPESGVRELAQVELVEVSLVSDPANEAAEVNEVKQQQQAELDALALASLAAAFAHATDVTLGDL